MGMESYGIKGPGSATYGHLAGLHAVFLLTRNLDSATALNRIKVVPEDIAQPITNRSTIISGPTAAIARGSLQGLRLISEKRFAEQHEEHATELSNYV